MGPYGDWGDGVGRALAWAKVGLEVGVRALSASPKAKSSGLRGWGRPGRRPTYGKIGVKVKSR